MNLIRNNKAFSIILGLVVFAGAAYLIFSGGSGTTDSLLTSTAAGGPSVASKELLVTLSNLKTVRLDDSIFKDPLFQSLQDFGVQIPLQPTGRRNPFAPIGSTGVSNTTQTQSQAGR